MNHIVMMQRLTGVDAGYHSSNMHPVDREGCVGKNGIDKSFTLERVIELAYKMESKPNIIIKAGPNAKWYLKRFSKEAIDEEIDKQRWRDTSRCTMYVIEWD